MGLLDLAAKIGIGAGGSLIANRLSRVKPSPDSSDILARYRTGMDTSANAGQRFLGAGRETLQQPIDYYTKILSGDRGAVTSALAPEISKIGEKYRTAERTSAALNPRGGPSAEFLAELPFQQQHDVTTLLQGARSDAAKTLPGLAGTLINSGNQELSRSTALGSQLLDEANQQRALETERSKNIGASLFDLMTKYGDNITADSVKDVLRKIGILKSPASGPPDIPGSIGTVAGTIGSGMGAGSTAPYAGLIGAPGASAATPGVIGLGAGSTGASSVTPAAATEAAGAPTAHSALIGMATNPVTLGVAGAIAAATAWMKSQAHHEATTWVREFQNPFDSQMREIERQYRAAAGNMTPQQKAVLRQQAQDIAAQYERKLAEFAAKGKDERKVAAQAKATADQYYGPGFTRFLNQFV